MPSSPTVFRSECLLALQEEECFLGQEQGVLEAEPVMSPPGSLTWIPSPNTTSSIQGFLFIPVPALNTAVAGLSWLKAGAGVPGRVPTVS